MSASQPIPAGIHGGRPFAHRLVLAARGDFWSDVSIVLIFGYLCFSRTFAYLGIPPFKLFIGEACLAAFLLLGPRAWGQRWPQLVTRLPALRRLTTSYVLFFVYGLLEVARGVALGHPLLLAIRDLCFNYYPVYVSLGILAGMKRPNSLPGLIRAMAWFNGVYGTLYVLVLSRLSWYMPGVGQGIAPVDVFAQPIYSCVLLFGLLAYERNVRKSWYLLVLNGFVLLGMQIRTEWLAFAIGVLVWGLLNGKTKKITQTVVILAAVLLAMYVGDVRMASPTGRAEENFSARKLVDRAIAPFRADVHDVSGASGNPSVESQEATFVWRTVWWISIWNTVHRSREAAVFGFGYGYPLGDLVPYLQDEFIRTPHNEFFYALGYTGWIGVLLYGLFQFQILRVLWRARSLTQDAFGICYWMMMMAYSMFFPLGETPYGAIPFYLIIGWILGSFLAKSADKEVAYARFLLAGGTLVKA
jgi:hypothetical protein